MSTRLKASFRRCVMSSSAWEGSATPARMRVGEDDSGGILFEGFFDDFAGVNRCAVDRTLEHFLVADEPVAFVEEDHGEDFSLEGSEFEAEVISRGLGAGEMCAAPDAMRHMLAGCCDDFFETRLANAGRGVFICGVKNGLAHVRLRGRNCPVTRRSTSQRSGQGSAKPTRGVVAARAVTRYRR